MAKATFTIGFKESVDKYIPTDKMVRSAIRITRQYTGLASGIIHSNVVRRTPEGATGNLANSIQLIDRVHGTSIFGGVVSNSEYALPVEMGTRKHWAPIAPLKLWVRRVTGKDIGFAYYVQKKIAGEIKGKKGGTKARKMFEKGWRASRRRIVRLMETAHDKIIDAWARS